MKLSVVIPIYNEEKNLPLLYTRLKETCEKITPDYELIFINDGSRDASMQLIYILSQQNNAVKFISFSRNFGHQIAVSAGLDHAKGDEVVIIDADLQDPPELIMDLHKKMQEGYEVVYAKRRSRKGESVFKKFTARLFYRVLAKITSSYIPIDTGDFRIMSKKIVDVLKKMPEQQKFLRGQISWVGYRQTYMEYDRQTRNDGETGYTLVKMLRLAIDGITSFSNLPLKFATFAGFIVAGVTFATILYALYSFFVTKDVVPGWTSLILAVLFIGGVQLICIGIIGEYISRLSANVRNRPLYIIGNTNIEETQK